jgi:excisionase family DNA binding protein
VIADDDAKVLTIKEVAQILRCSKARVQNVLSGKVKDVPPLPFIPLGRRKLIRRESLLRWMERKDLRADASA